MIKVRGLSKSYDGNLVFENVSFDITKGSTTVIIGGSGCGKQAAVFPEPSAQRLARPDRAADVRAGSLPAGDAAGMPDRGASAAARERLWHGGIAVLPDV